VTRKASSGRPRAVGYVRVSTQKQADEGGSLAVQKEAVIRRSVLSGYELVQIFEDAGVSGGKGEEGRAGLKAAIDMVRRGEAQVLLVTHADRLARDIDEAGHARVEVKRAGGKVDVIAEAKHDPIRHAVDKMLAELERLRASERMRVWNAARRARGLPSGPAPYGFAIGPGGGLLPVTSEQPVIERMRQMREAGSTLQAIADALNHDRIRTRAGNPWGVQAVSNVLKRAWAANPTG
jgi:site-specific DNA recombinase